MNLKYRIDLLVRLGSYMKSDTKEWLHARKKATEENPWFIPEFTELSIQNTANRYLDAKILKEFANRYKIPVENNSPARVGIVMAGNIPLVGFHDFLCVFLTGHIAVIKTSSKDDVLIRHLADKLFEWETEMRQYITFSFLIPDCSAYIATGSNNSARYFTFYFRKYLSVIRKNRTSVAILEGNETAGELDKLADDVYQFFGMGCRNITKIYVPGSYNFEYLLKVFRKYDYLSNHNKYRNNYDYNLAVHILNNKYYMSNDSLILLEDESLFSPLAQLNYEYYLDADELKDRLAKDNNIQAIISKTDIPFGHAQSPEINNFADGIDTMDFLLNKLSNTVS